jgi:hypothetical protein
MYDPTDEKVDALFDALLKVFRGVPDNLGKQTLAKLFEDMALLEILVGKHDPGLRDPGRAEEVLQECWEEVERLRNERAASFLYSIQTNEF